MTVKILRKSVFITKEGYTYQPNTGAIETDIDNLQVVGFAKGDDEDKAFQNLLIENPNLLETRFNEIICLELKSADYYRRSKYFYLDEYKNNENTI